MIVPTMGTKTVPLSMGAALFGKTRLAILSLLYGQVDRAFYLSEIVRLANVGRGAVQRELARLTRAGLLTKTRQGNQTYFRANAEASIFDELRGLVRKTTGIVDRLHFSLEPLADRIQTAFVFGSVACVIPLQRAAQFAGNDTDDTVLSGVKPRIAVESVQGDIALLQPRLATGE